MDCYDVKFQGREGILEVKSVESSVCSRPLANNFFPFKRLPCICACTTAVIAGVQAGFEARDTREEALTRSRLQTRQIAANNTYCAS